MDLAYELKNLPFWAFSGLLILGLMSTWRVTVSIFLVGGCYTLSFEAAPRSRRMDFFLVKVVYVPEG